MKLEAFVHEDRLYIIHDQPFGAWPRLDEYEGDLTIKFDDGTQTKIDAPQIEEPDAILEAAIVLAEGPGVQNRETCTRCCADTGKSGGGS